ncbi:MAG TPA: transposase [Terriglobales bacterium]|jgi:putative transposase|nr:transposase [Terriglobales bacterium]
MSKPPRDLTSFGYNTYFITATTWQSRTIFQSDRMALLLLDTLFQYRLQQKFLLHEFVAMPNHLHLLLTPTGIPLERAIQFIKGGFSFRVKKELGSNLEIWERGYVDHRIRDLEDYDRHVKYIRQNPIKAHLASAEDEYPHSSARSSFERDPCPQWLKPQISAGLLRHG